MQNAKKIHKSKNPNIQKSKKPNIQKSRSKNPKIKKMQDSVDVKSFCFFFHVWVFGLLDFLECWISGCLYSRSSDLCIFAHQELHFRVPWVPGLDNTTIYICTIYLYVHIGALAQPGFCSGGRISGRPKNGAPLSTSTHKNDDGKSLVIVHCLVPVLTATMITKVLLPVWIH